MGGILKLFAVTAGLLLSGGLVEFVQAQADAPDPLTHDTFIQANKGGKRLTIETDAGAQTYNNANFVQVTASSITIPGVQNGIIVGTFTAESDCTGGSWCSVRITCDGVELAPVVGADFAFDSPDGNQAWQSLSVTRRSELLPAGTHSCEVETAQVGGSTLRLDDWTFVLEYWRLP